MTETTNQITAKTDPLGTTSPNAATLEATVDNMRAVLAAVPEAAEEVVISSTQLKVWLKVVESLLPAQGDSSTTKIEEHGPDQLSKAYLLALLNDPTICPPYPGWQGEWRKIKIQYETALNSPNINERVLATSLLKDMSLFALHGFMEPEAEGLKQKINALALLVQGESPISETLKSAGAKFRENYRLCTSSNTPDGKLRTPSDFAKILPLERDGRSILIDNVLFVCVGEHPHIGVETPGYQFKWAVDCAGNSGINGIVGYTRTTDLQPGHLTIKAQYISPTEYITRQLKEMDIPPENMEPGDWHLRSKIAKILVERLCSFERNDKNRLNDFMALHTVLFNETKREAVRKASTSIPKWEGLLQNLKQLLCDIGIRTIETPPHPDIERLKKERKVDIVVNNTEFQKIAPTLRENQNMIVLKPDYESRSTGTSIGGKMFIVARE